MSHSPPPILEQRSKACFIRRKRELQTVEVMIGLYCDGHRHQQASPRGLCRDCLALLDYAARRLELCVFGEAKPTCAKCLVHCYSADKREQIRVVMRWAGPRMLLRHPLRVIIHLLDKRRPAPNLSARPLPRQARSRSESGIESPGE